MKKLLCLTLSLLSSNIFCSKYNLSNCKEMMEKFEQERVVRPAATASNEGIVVTKAIPAVVAEVAPEVVAKTLPAVVVVADALDDAVAKFKQENPLTVQMWATLVKYKPAMIIKNLLLNLRLKGVHLVILPDGDSKYTSVKAQLTDDRCMDIQADHEDTLYSQILENIYKQKKHKSNKYFAIEPASKCRKVSNKSNKYECIFSLPNVVAISMREELEKNK